MSDDGSAPRLQEIFTALVQKSIGESLGRVEEAIASWRRGERDLLQAHMEILRHAARTSVLTTRVDRAQVDGPNTLIRDALDAGVIDREEARALLGKDPNEVPPSPSIDDDAARMAVRQAPDKRTTMDKLIGGGPVLVHLDPRRQGVDVPRNLKNAPRLLLRFGYGLTPPILDLTIEEQGVSGTLTFSGIHHRCFVPWVAVFAIVGDDGRGRVWESDVPAEVAAEYKRDAEAQDKEPADESTPPPPEDGKPRRGHLRLV